MSSAYSKIKQLGGMSYFDYPSEFDFVKADKSTKYKSIHESELLLSAIEDLNKALLIDSSKVEIYYYLGNAYFRSNQLQKAEEFFKMDIDSGTQNELSYFSLWAILIDTKRFDEATSSTEDFLFRHPDDEEEYYTFRSLIEAKRGDFIKALEYGKQFVSLIESQYPIGAYEAHTFLSEVHLKLGNTEEHFLEQQKAQKAKQDYQALFNNN